jgi:hypothetical protein
MAISDDAKWLHAEMIRIEQHWTDQTQNQQRRIGAVLAVNGFLLAFLAAGGLGISEKLGRGWYLYPYYLCLVLLAAALVFGMLTLVPRLKIGGGGTPKEPQNSVRQWMRDSFMVGPMRPPDLWLDSARILERFTAADPETDTVDTTAVVIEIARSAAANEGWNKDIKRSNEQRRRWMHWQIAFILVGILALIVAVVGLAQHVLGSG